MIDTGLAQNGQRLRIEMVLPSLVVAGMEVVVAELCAHLRDRGHDVGIACLDFAGPLAASTEKRGIVVTVCPTPGIWPIFAGGELAKWLARRKPDVVHAHSGAWLKAAVAARRTGVRTVITTVHGLHDNTTATDLLQMAFAGVRTDHCVAVADPLAEFLTKAARVPARKVSTIPNGVDTSKFRPRGPTKRDELGILPTDLVVGTVSRFAPVKNHSLLLRAFSETWRRVPTARLLLVGDGPLRQAVEAQASTLGISSRVTLVGEVFDPAPYYRTMDVFVLPSRAEGTSVSLLEAMSCGVPGVGTAVGGTPAVLDHGRAGRIVPTDDCDALVAALVGLLGDAGIRGALGSAARLRVECAYSITAMTDRYLALYRRMPLTEGGDIAR